jgi:hypothetical protein
MEVFVSAMTLSSLTAVTSFGSPAAIDAFAVASSASAVASVVAACTARLTADRLTEGRAGSPCRVGASGRAEGAKALGAVGAAR